MAGADVGGAELFFERLAIAFHQAGVSQQICIKPHAARIARLSEAGLMVHSSSYSPLTAPLQRLRYKQLIKQAGADILLTGMNRATQLAPQGNFVHVARQRLLQSVRHSGRSSAPIHKALPITRSVKVCPHTKSIIR